MRIEQYFLMTDYSLWDVVLNGDSPVPTRIVEGVLQLVAPTTAKQRLAQKNELEARGTASQNLAFVSSSHTDSTTDSVSATVSVSIICVKLPASSLPNVDSLSNAIDGDDLEETDLRWQMAMLTIWARRFQPSGGYHDVPPPITGTFMPPKPNLVVNTALTSIETDHHAFTVADSMDESKTHASQFVPSFVQSSEQVKSPRHTVQPTETSIPAATPAPASPKSTSSGKRRNRKTCFVRKSVDHLINDCDYHAKKMAQPTQRNYAHMGNHKQYASLTHKKPQKHMVPTAVLTQSKPVLNTAVRPVSAAVPQIMVTRPRYAHQVFSKSKSPIRRHITRSLSPQTSNSPPRVTVAQAPMISAAQGMQGKWVWRPKCPILDHDSQTTSASMTLKWFDYNDALGRSKSVMAWVPRRI
nr:hypothetical protein [Tanacetum cinerariifolium]